MLDPQALYQQSHIPSPSAHIREVMDTPKSMAGLSHTAHILSKITLCPHSIYSHYVLVAFENVYDLMAPIAKVPPQKSQPFPSSYL